MPESAFPSCFGGEYSAGEESSFGSSARNAVSCLYRTALGGECRMITISWFKNFLGQGLSVTLDDEPRACCKIEMRPWSFWKKQGSKAFQSAGGENAHIFYDFTSARFSSGLPEPTEGFFVAIAVRSQLILLLGDMQSEACRRSGAQIGPAATALLVSRRENLYGGKFFSTKVRFCEGGDAHEVMIECSDMGSSCSGSFDAAALGGTGNGYSSSSTSGSSSSNGSGRSSSSGRSSGRSSGCTSGGAAGGVREPRLIIRVDRKIVVCVKRLAWKFRGNQTVVVDGQAVEVFWDVHNWLFNGSGSGVFMFQMCSSSSSSLPEGDKPWFKAQQQQQQQQQPGFSLFLHAFRYPM